MATFTKVKETDAPARPRTAGRLAERMRLFESYIGEVGRAQVGRLVPEDGESARGVALRINRAARRAGKTIESWIVDDVVYFRPVRS